MFRGSCFIEVANASSPQANTTCPAVRIFFAAFTCAFSVELIFQKKTLSISSSAGKKNLPVIYFRRSFKKREVKYAGQNPMIGILEELEELLPELSEGELKALERSMREDGMRDLIVLGETDSDGIFILDGHSRFRMCKKIGIGPRYLATPVKFADISQARLWIINNQLARRNLNTFQLYKAALLKEGIYKEQAKERVGIIHHPLDRIKKLQETHLTIR